MKRLLMGCVICLVLIIAAGGCGYSTRSLLPSNFQSIYVENFVNKIPVAEEQTDARMYREYSPGLERKVTKAVIDRFLFDGNLRVKTTRDADLVLKGELIDFRRDALRYDVSNNVEEYRTLLIVNLSLSDMKTGALVWEENGFVGETAYRTSGTLAKTESASIDDAISDLARRVVERTIEAW